MDMAHSLIRPTCVWQCLEELLIQRIELQFYAMNARPYNVSEPCLSSESMWTFQSYCLSNYINIYWIIWNRYHRNEWNESSAGMNQVHIIGIETLFEWNDIHRIYSGCSSTNGSYTIRAGGRMTFESHSIKRRRLHKVTCFFLFQTVNHTIRVRTNIIITHVILRFLIQFLNEALIQLQTYLIDNGSKSKKIALFRD